MKTLVTGANGFLGSGVVRALRAEGHAVRALVRASSDTRRIDDLPDLERFIGDIHDEEAMARAIDGCAGVIHLAGISDWKDVTSADMERSIVDGTRTVLRAAERAGGPRVVYVSSISAINGAEEPILFDEQSPCTLPLDDPAFVFVKTKRSAEDLCREAAGRGLPAVIVNPCETFAPWDTGLITSRNLINWWKMPLVTVTAGGVCVGHGEDVARGITAALTRGRPGERYILGGENITVQQMAEHFFEALGERRSVLVVPTALARGFTRFAQTVGLPLPYTPQIIPFASRWWYMNSQKAQTELGVRFRGAAEAIAPTARWLRDGGWLR